MAGQRLAIAWMLVLACLAAALVGTSVRSASSPLAQPAATERPLLSPPPSFAHLPAGEVSIRPGPAAPMTQVGTDGAGDPLTTACSTCHATRDPNPQAGEEAMPVTFHTDLRFAHGGLSCLSCHGADSYDALRLADGRRLDYEDVMTLCAQCHGGRARDYANGAHGGMVGYWDLSRGGRVRNNCVDCHDPHAPAFPAMLPTFRPIDRFLRSKQQEGGH